MRIYAHEVPINMYKRIVCAKCALPFYKMGCVFKLNSYFYNAQGATLLLIKLSFTFKRRFCHYKN